MMECLAENGEDPDALVVQVARLQDHIQKSASGGRCYPSARHELIEKLQQDGALSGVGYLLRVQD